MPELFRPDDLTISLPAAEDLVITISFDDVLGLLFVVVLLV